MKISVSFKLDVFWKFAFLTIAVQKLNYFQVKRLSKSTPFEIKLCQFLQFHLRIIVLNAPANLNQLRVQMIGAP